MSKVGWNSYRRTTRQRDSQTLLQAIKPYDENERTNVDLHSSARSIVPSK